VTKSVGKSLSRGRAFGAAPKAASTKDEETEVVSSR